VLGLLLAFRNRAAYDRWWEGRRLWGELINESRDLAWKVRAYVAEDLWRPSRFAATLAGFADALKGHLRSGVRLQEIAGFEKEPAQPAHVPSYLAGQILIQLADWHRAGTLDLAGALILDPHARRLLEICGACERIRNTTISASYTALIRGGIGLSIL